MTDPALLLEGSDPERLPAAGPRTPAIVAVAVAGAVAAAAAAILAVAAGGTDGSVSGDVSLLSWALSLAKLAMDLTGLGMLGTVLFAAVLVPAPGGLLTTPARAGMVAASRWALGLAGAATATGVLTMAEISGPPVRAALSLTALRAFFTGVAQGQALILVVVIAAMLAFASRRARGVAESRLLLVLALAALVPPTLTGHATGAASHGLAVLTIIVHVLAVSCWTGGLAAVVVFARGPAIGPAAARFSAVAFACFGLAALSGAINAWIRLGGGTHAFAQLWTGQYGWLVVAKVAAVVVLGGFGWWHRRRTLPAVVAGRTHAFRRFAAVELVVMVLTVTLAVALSHTPTPAPTGRTELGIPCSTDRGDLIGTYPATLVARWAYECAN